MSQPKPKHRLPLVDVAAVVSLALVPRATCLVISSADPSSMQLGNDSCSHLDLSNNLAGSRNAQPATRTRSGGASPQHDEWRKE